MSVSNNQNISLETADKIELTDSQFKKLSDFIYLNYGIKMPVAKRIMLQSRLIKRLRALSFSNFNEYIDYVFSEKGNMEEIIQMMDVVSTNKTDFFREPGHFDFITQFILPELNKNYYINNTFKVWSAGSSSGEEAYSIAITLQEWANTNKGFKYFITGSDISLTMLNTASKAIYEEKRIEVIPDSIKHKYFLKSKDRTKKLVRLIPELRSKTNFFRLNFMDADYKINEKYDLIFCRNTLIYFDRETQDKVLVKLSKYLKPDGFLFIGHSESILSREIPFKQIKPTIYRLSEK
ncbi:MAG: methyltransferase domain-containing protein [Chlorobi bacterium]|nr:methyltransferase domain-containing protein [Chlorobiota bacterium]